MNKHQIRSQIQINYFMPCASPQFLELAQQYYNHTKEQTKRSLSQQTQECSHKRNLDSLHL